MGLGGHEGYGIGLKPELAVRRRERSIARLGYGVLSCRWWKDRRCGRIDAEEGSEGTQVHRRLRAHVLGGGGTGPTCGREVSSEAA